MGSYETRIQETATQVSSEGNKTNQIVQNMGEAEDASGGMMGMGAAAGGNGMRMGGSMEAGMGRFGMGMMDMMGDDMDMDMMYGEDNGIGRGMGRRTRTRSRGRPGGRGTGKRNADEMFFPMMDGRHVPDRKILREFADQELELSKSPDDLRSDIQVTACPAVRSLFVAARMRL